jgi:hypothetical protein
MMHGLLEHVTTEWEVLKNAPIAVALVFLIAFLVAFAVVRWSSALQLREVRKRLAGMDERLAAKDMQLAEYRERLHLATSGRFSYSGLSNLDLRGTALKWVDELRESLALDEDEAPAISCDQVKADAIVLRDELLTRLPSYARDDRWFSLYERVEDTAGMAAVADDLERLADSLSG